MLWPAARGQPRCTGFPLRSFCIFHLLPPMAGSGGFCAGSHLRWGNEGGVVQEAAFGQRALIGAQGVWSERRSKRQKAQTSNAALMFPEIKEANVMVCCSGSRSSRRWRRFWPWVDDRKLIWAEVCIEPWWERMCGGKGTASSVLSSCRRSFLAVRPRIWSWSRWFSCCREWSDWSISTTAREERRFQHRWGAQLGRISAPPQQQPRSTAMNCKLTNLSNSALISQKDCNKRKRPNLDADLAALFIFKRVQGLYLFISVNNFNFLRLAWDKKMDFYRPKLTVTTTIKEILEIVLQYKSIFLHVIILSFAAEFLLVAQ